MPCVDTGRRPRRLLDLLPAERDRIDAQIAGLADARDRLDAIIAATKTHTCAPGAWQPS